MAKNYHRERCQSCIRMSIIDPIGRQIILTGIHAFEWSVAIISTDKITVTQFSNRVTATKEFNRYRRKR